MKQEVDFFLCALLQVRDVSFYSYFAETFYHEWMLNLAKCFFFVTTETIMILLFSLLIL